jgi:hypothetical protein
MTLPIDRTALAAAITNQVPNTLLRSALNIAALTTPYNTIDELYNYVLSLVTSGTLSPYPPAEYNKLINGNFDVWQRGTTQLVSASGAYFPDRFSVVNFTSTASSIKIDQGSSNPPIGSKYYLRYRLSTAAAVLNSVSRFFRYKMESIDVQKLIGNQVTISFKIKSSVSRNFLYSMNVYGFTSADNGINGTGLIAGDGDYAQNTVALTANTWQTISITFTLQDPSSGTGLASNGISIELWGRYTTTGAETDTEYQFAQIQLVSSSVALPFQPRNFADEYLACLRYYEKTYSLGTAAGANTQSGIIYVSAHVVNDGNATVIIPFKVAKRTVPTMVIYNGVGTSGYVDKAVNGGVFAASNASLTFNSATYNNENGFLLFTGGNTAGQMVAYGLHYTADAEL